MYCGRGFWRSDLVHIFFFFFSSRRRHTRLQGDWSSDVCSSDLEAPVEGRSAFGDQIPEDEDEGQHRNERQHGHEGGHGPADDAAAQAARAHSARLPTAVPRATRQIMRRASAFTATVITNRMSPTSNSAER